MSCWERPVAKSNKFFAGYIGGVGTADQVKHILICILVGVILFVLPLEKIFEKTYGVIRYCGSFMTDKKKYRDETSVFLLVFLYALICLMGAMSIWFLIELANMASVKLVTCKDDLTFAIVCAETVMFIIYMPVQRRLNIAACLVSLLCGVILFLAGCEDIFTSRQKISGASIVNDMSQSGSIPDQFFEARYNITIIETQAGTAVCVLWFVLFAILSLAVIWSAVKIMKLSARRGVFVLGLYMVEAFLLIYTVLAEVGYIKPAETLLLITDVVIPAMILCLRMFYFRDVSKNGRQYETI